MTRHRKITGIFRQKKTLKTEKKIVKWQEIGCGIYKLHEVQDRGLSKYGPSVVLKLEHASGKIFLVWAPASLAYEILYREQTSFINNLGMKRSEKGNMYYDSSCYKHVNCVRTTKCGLVHQINFD